MHKIPTKTVQKLRRWFRKEMRVLPWRATREIYPIWLSEVMLQQTTVETVKSRFASFIERFPTLSDLANASEQDVLHQWQGLGYYSRARNLHRAAKTIVSKYGEEPPADADFWTALPGVGRYIVGAVLAQAFEQKLPIVEANTRRLWARFLAIAKILNPQPQKNGFGRLQRKFCQKSRSVNSIRPVWSWEHSSACQKIPLALDAH
ncbi:MAG: hypothetical protein R3B84_13830 [Zavarzinella sp.]